jgi:hypothetical protein
MNQITLWHVAEYKEGSEMQGMVEIHYWVFRYVTIRNNKHYAMYNSNIQGYMNLFQNKSPTGKTFKTILILFIHHHTTIYPFG